jgi:transcription elongation factor Elf1
MPKYRFTCTSCSSQEEKYASVKQETAKCTSCGSESKREFPQSGSQVVREVVDSFTNVRHTDDFQKEIRDRKEEHFWEVEVPRMVQHYSIETCLEEGWLVYNDKGELVIGKAPSKR